MGKSAWLWGKSICLFIRLQLLITVCSKANRLEIWIASQEGLVMVHSKAIHGQVSMLQKLRPANSPVDHLFVGTDNHQYFTVCWDGSKKQFETVQSMVDVTDRHVRDSLSLDRCLVDPTGQHVILELYEGVLSLTRLMNPRKGTSDYLEKPEQVRIAELNIRASTFLYTESKSPKVAFLYEDNYKNRTPRLVTYSLMDEKGQYKDFNADRDRETDFEDIDPGATLLIPVPKGDVEQKRYISRNSSSARPQLGGVIVVGETRCLYLDHEANATVEYALDEASSFVAWAMYDKTRYLVGDELGWLYLLTINTDGAFVDSLDLKKIGETSRATTLVLLGNDLLYIGSHEGDSQLVRVDLMGYSLDVVQTMPNIAPILDFEVMDLGNRSRDAEAVSNDYSTGQARLVTGSGCYKTGTLRSVRSGVGLEDIGLLGEMENVRAMFSLRTTNETYADTLVLSFPTETRILRFDDQGEVEELEQFLGMNTTEGTVLTANIAHGRIIQVTASAVAILDVSSGGTVASWAPSISETITAASTNQNYVLLSIGGNCLVSLDIQGGLTQSARQDLGDSDQVACLFVPSEQNVGVVGFWQNGSVSILELPTLKIVQGETVRDPDSAAVPRSIAMAQILPPNISGPTLLVSMSDGTVVTFTLNASTYALSGKKRIMLGVQHANLQLIPRDDGLCNVFATCENSSLIYGSEGRIIYSAVTAEDAICVCPFNSEAYPDTVVLATAAGVKLSQIDTERRTHVKTLHIGETVRRITYSAEEHLFGLGSVQRDIVKGEETVRSSFRFVDEVAFAELGKPYIFDTADDIEIIECCIRAILPNSYGEPQERFIVGTSYLRDDEAGKAEFNGKIRVFGVNKDRSPSLIMTQGLKSACRCLGVVDGKIFAGLLKTVVVYNYIESSTGSATLEKLATYRCSTCPIDIDVTGNVVAVGDLMKSMTLIEYLPGKDGERGQLKEVARHIQAGFSTAVAHVEGDSYLMSDADGNLTVLRRNVDGVTDTDRHRLEVTSEFRLGEMVNRIRKFDVSAPENALISPKAFMCTVSDTREC